MDKPRMAQCWDCSRPIENASGQRRFCDTFCKQRWNNRCMQRGKQAYHALMNNRYNREEATEMGFWSLLSSMAQAWREEDLKTGRQSFLPAKDVVENNIQYRAKRFNIR